MRDAFGFFLCNLVRDDRQSMIQLHCIAVDYFAIELPCNLDGELSVVISTCGCMTRREFYTSDLPVPVAPTMAIKGCFGACAIFRVLAILPRRSMHSRLSSNRIGVQCLSG